MDSKLSFDMMLETPSTSPLMRYVKDFDMCAYDEPCNKKSLEGLKNIFALEGGAIGEWPSGRQREDIIHE
ncbi:hypothetical protein Tco_0054837, partial [Tanacetum coccineum]